MRRVSVLVSVVAAVLLGLLVAQRALDTTAQEATPAVMPEGEGTPGAAGHPLVGSWALDDPQGEPSVTAFTSDGIVIDATGAAPGIGSWQPTGPREGAFTIVLQRADEDFVGTIVIRGTAEVDAGSDAMTAPFSFTVVAADGTVLVSGEGIVTGRRIPVEPPEAHGTPLAVYPTRMPAMPEAATPTA